MANIKLNSSESLIGRGIVSYRDLEKHTYQCWHATIFVTNQRILLDTYTEIELKLSKIRGFTFGKMLLFIPYVKIYGLAEKTTIGKHGLTEDAYTFTGFPNKKASRLAETGRCPGIIIQSDKEFGIKRKGLFV